MGYLSNFYESAERWDDLVALYERDLKAKDLSSPERIGDMLQIAMLMWRKAARPGSAESWFERISRLEPTQPIMLEFYREYATPASRRASLDGHSRCCAARDERRPREDGDRQRDRALGRGPGQRPEGHRAVQGRAAPGTRTTPRLATRSSACTSRPRATTPWSSSAPGARAHRPRATCRRGWRILREIASVYRELSEERHGAGHRAEADRAARREARRKRRRGGARARGSTRSWVAGATCSPSSCTWPSWSRTGGEEGALPRRRATLARAVLERAERDASLRGAARGRSRRPRGPRAARQSSTEAPRLAGRSTSCTSASSRRLEGEESVPILTRDGAARRRALEPRRRRGRALQGVLDIDPTARRSSTRSRSRPSAARTGRRWPTCSSGASTAAADDASEARRARKARQRLRRSSLGPRRRGRDLATRARALARVTRALCACCGTPIWHRATSTGSTSPIRVAERLGGPGRGAVDGRRSRQGRRRQDRSLLPRSAGLRGAPQRARARLSFLRARARRGPDGRARRSRA